MVKKETPRPPRMYSRSTGDIERGYGASPSSGDDISLPSVRTGTRASYRGYNRSTMGSRLTLPYEFHTPGPDAYTIKTSIGQNQGASFKGDRGRAFEQAKSSNAVFLLPQLVNKSPSPGTYEIKSSIGRGPKSTFGTARRDSRFGGDRINNAIFLLQKYDDPSPAPTRYNYKSSIGSTPSYVTHPSAMSNTTSKSGRSFPRAKRDSRFSGEQNAKFLLPEIISKNPSPSHYRTEAVNGIGNRKSRGSTFGRSKRNSRFPGDDRALFLLTERLDKIRRPSSYTYKT